MSEEKEVKCLEIFFSLIKELLAERSFDPRTSRLWARQASTAPLCCWWITSWNLTMLFTVYYYALSGAHYPEPLYVLYELLTISVICYMELPCSTFYKRCLCALFILLNEKLFFFFTSSAEQNYWKRWCILHLVKSFIESCKSIAFAFHHVDLVVVAEWLRRWTWNPLGFPRAGSNSADYDKWMSSMVLLREKVFFQYLAIINFQCFKIPWNVLQ